MGPRLRRPGARASRWPPRSAPSTREPGRAGALDARLLPAGRRLERAHHVRGGAPARRPLVLRPAHPRDAVRPADPVDDRVVPGRRRPGWSTRSRCPTSRRPRQLPSSPSGTAISTAPRRSTGRASGRWTCATSTSRSSSTGAAERTHAPGRLDARRRAAPGRPALHAAVLAYASDYTLLEPVLRAHGRGWSDPGLKAASLDHAMWWHRPGPGRRLAPLRAGQPFGPGCPRPRHRQDLHPGRGSRRHGRAGGHAPGPARHTVVRRARRLEA